MKTITKKDYVWVSVLLLSAFMILTESLKNCTFRIENVELTYSLFLLPISFFIVNYIAKKYDYKKAIAAIAISAVMFSCYSGIVSFIFVDSLMIGSIIGEVCSYVLAQLIGLFLYVYIINNTKSRFWLIFCNYIFSLIIFYMIYTLIYLDMVTVDTYWLGYLITMIFQLIMCIILTLLDKKIK